MKKVIIVVLAVVLTVGAGLIVPIMMNKDTISVNTYTNQGQVTHTPVSTTEPTSTQKADETPGIVHNTPEVKVDKSPEVGVSSTQTPISMSFTPTPIQTAEQGTNNTSSPAATEGTIKTPQPTATQKVEPSPTPSAHGKKGSQEWVERKIEEHRDEILDEDLADFRRIYSKVDIGYVQSFGKDGYTDEETEQLRAYLRSTLGGADYERSKILFYRYSYILEEE